MTDPVAGLAPSAREERLALILGAAGSAGRAIATAFADRGWRVRALHRRGQQPGLPPAVSWMRGDAADPATVAQAAEGAVIIVHAANPPNYRKWGELGIPMLVAAIAAARTSGARLIFPGNIYNFDPGAGSVIDEQSPQNPVSRKGAVRVEMERLLAEASQEGARSIVLRAGDFFGRDAKTSWLHAVMVKGAGPVKSVTYPGDHTVGHAWAYLPNFAETIVAIADIEARLPAFDVYHFGGHWVEPGVEMAREAALALGQPDLPVRALPWGLLRLAAPFSGFLRELLEMQYLWRQPIRLNNKKLVGLLGSEPHTPLAAAMRQSLPSSPLVTLKTREVLS